MAALHSRCGHYILALCFFSSSSFFSFLASSQRSQSGCLPYFYTWCGLSVNLECKFEMCCTRLARNTGSKNDAKNSHLDTIAQICRAESSQLRHVSTIGKNKICPPHFPQRTPSSNKLKNIIILSTYTHNSRKD